MARELRGTRYLTKENEELKQFIVNELKYLDYEQTVDAYDHWHSRTDAMGRALWGCNDRFYLLTHLLGRLDVLNPWLFDRCREVEANPDGYIDLWARFHYKSTLITFGGAIQEIVCDPEIKIAIFSVVKPIAQEFLSQIKEEFETNDYLKAVYSDVLWENPKAKGVEGRPPKWSIARGITVKRRSNPKEATLEAHGLLDGQPTSRHFDLHIYDDVVTQDYLSEDQIKKTTTRWEMADNLGSHLGVRKWMPGTRYHFADTNGIIIDRKSLKPRIYPATDDGTLTGKPVFLSLDRWNEIKRDQQSTVSAQMLLNPISGSEATFKSVWFQTYDVIPAVMNVYIMCDPSKGKTQRSDRTALAVVGIDPGGNKYLLDGFRHRMKLSERYACLKMLENKWRSHPGVFDVKVGYEQYGMQSDIEVIEDTQEREGHFFHIEEMNTPRQGKHSKDDRIERLEPDLRLGRFYLPAVVHHPDFGGADGRCLWTVWTDDDLKEYEKRQKDAAEKKACPYQVGQILYRPMKGPTRMQRYMEQTAQTYRIVTALKRRDENKDVYDVTRGFIEEAVRHPFAAHDDFIDATSRIFDLEPAAPVPHEAQATDPLAEDDVGQQHLDA